MPAPLKLFLVTSLFGGCFQSPGKVDQGACAAEGDWGQVASSSFLAWPLLSLWPEGADVS